MVTIKRVSSELSPRALRTFEMLCVKLPSSTKASPHTASSSSSLVTKRLGFWARKIRTCIALGLRKTGEYARDRVLFAGSSTNCPKRYKLLIGTRLAYTHSELFIFFESSEGLPQSLSPRIRASEARFT